MGHEEAAEENRQGAANHEEIIRPRRADGEGVLAPRLVWVPAAVVLANPRVGRPGGGDPGLVAVAQGVGVEERVLRPVEPDGGEEESV